MQLIIKDSNGNSITSEDMPLPTGKDAPTIVGCSIEDYTPGNSNE